MEVRRDGVWADWRGLVDNAPDPCFLVDRSGMVLYANAACGDSIHSPMVGRSVYESSPEDRRERTRHNLEQVFRSGESVKDHFAYRGPNEEYWFTMRYIPIFGEQAEGTVAQRSPRYVGVVALDETEQHLVERALARSEARYRHLIENSLDIIAVIDGRLNASFVSSNVREHMGWSVPELRAMCLRELIHPDDLAEVDRKFERLRKNPERPQTLEVKIRRKDGGYATLEAQARQLDQASESSRFVVNCRDITERKESERLRQNLFRADKLAAIGQLAAGVAHEINNPASFITTNLYVLREYTDAFRGLCSGLREVVDELPDDQRDMVLARISQGRPYELLGEMNRMIEANLEGMERIRLIVQDLRSFSRDEPERNETVDLNEVVRAAGNMVKNQAAYVAELVFELGELPVVVGDSSKLHQVVLNLLVNAVHAVTDGDHADQRITVRTSASQGQVIVEIEDTGCGIPRHARERVFEPFYTTKPPEQGTGLGLWMCAEIVRKHRGTLSHEPREGRGTRFVLCLPDEKPSNARHDRPSGEFVKITPPAEPVRVLVVDDDELVLDSYQKLFAGQHQITIALGGKKAISILGDRDDFDVILCDVVMPEVDGVAVYEHLTRHLPHLLPRTVFCTAGTFTTRTRTFTERIREQLVYKPLTPRQLDELIRRVAQRG